jgi:hypothetical protein
MMPFTFFLLELLLYGFLLFFHPLVLVNQAINLCFQLINIVEVHWELHHKTSCWSLVLTQLLVKLSKFQQKSPKTNAGIVFGVQRRFSSGESS